MKAEETTPRKPWERFSRVEQKLQELAKQASGGRALGDRVTGTSEETASLFSAGTTPAVRILADGR